MWKLKHANSILASLEYFCQISSKLNLTILSYTVSNLVRFLRHSVVRKFITPVLPIHLISDQFAYRPTASTTAALISLTHAVAQKLESCNYVRCLQIDYAKAFDTINHPMLFRTLRSLSIPPQIQRWIFQFLTGRQQAVISGGQQSKWLPITRSVVQGSGIGPSAYLVYSIDLKALFL